MKCPLFAVLVVVPLLAQLSSCTHVFSEIPATSPGTHWPRVSSHDDYIRCAQVPVLTAEFEQMAPAQLATVVAAERTLDATRGKFPIVTTREDGTREQYSGMPYAFEGGAIVYELRPAQSCFTVTKIYRHNGALASKFVTFNGASSVRIGRTYAFAEDGAPEKTVDADTPYAVTFPQVIAVLEREHIPVSPGFQNDPVHTLIFRGEVVLAGPRWFIKWPRSASQFELVTLDATSGAILSRALSAVPISQHKPGEP